MKLESDCRFYRDTWVEVDLDCIASNINHAKALLPKDVQIIAVIKANAYGHGDYQVAKTALENGATYLAVAFLDEAMSLRKKGIEAPILILGATRPQDVNIAAENRITLTVFQEEWVQEAKKILKKDHKLKVHMKLDTGMGRIGLRTPEELQRLEKLITEDDRFLLEGVFTHFSTADEKNQSYFNQQLDCFNKLIGAFSHMPPLVHASNSAATLRFPQSIFNGVRLGITMYGLTPSLEIKDELPFPLHEAFSLKTKLVHVKKIMPGDKISYGATYEAEKEEWIGTLPIGYADGWIRKLQGQEVLVNGMRVPIVGRICMDQCMIRLPYEMPVGTVVTLIGKDGSEKISVDEIAKRLDTINYEVTCTISVRVPRVYKKGGKFVECRNPLV